eukprot:CAMPEP_0113719808 /NCGR_PEP_ID=MMETSP0038_2-20120614/36068_1 /TAXON_ID=2898 /ORGANISM="Cryptomonas paramecium" /LENGTH=208 /DNA_ID=CAMNT_0000648317 /DNA_START=112 /DNA_END=734 /DNA_ORIENTATION=- /assembly_acc=CAM_ASM_000170
MIFRMPRGLRPYSFVNGTSEVTFSNNTAPEGFRFKNFIVYGSNVDATMQEDEPSHGSKHTLKSVWFKWQAPCNATISVSTAGSVFDTAIAVYIPAFWDRIDITNEFGILLVVSRGNETTSDDIVWNQDRTSAVLFNAAAGQLYLIAVGGYNGSQGSFTLNGTVRSWTPLPPYIPSVSSPYLILDRLGTPRCADCALHDRFTTIALACA